MFRLVLGVLLMCGACGVAEKPDSARTVAAYEVSLPTVSDKARFVELLRRHAETEGFHVDAATSHELNAMSQVSPITFNATVWRGEDDSEVMASAMDFRDRIGRVWISFPRGQDPGRSARFRKSLVSELMREWPRTASLPVMPNGAIPLTHDLVRTPSGYSVKPSAAAKYENKGR